MAYHEYGVIKYDELGKEYGLDIPPIDRDRLSRIKKYFEQYSLKVQIGG